MARRIFSIVTYILLFLAVLFLTGFYMQPLFLLLEMLMLALPLVSYLVTRFVFSRLQTSVSCHSSFAVSDETISCELLLDNPTIFPLLDCTLTYQISSSFYPCDQQRNLICPAYSKGDFRFQIPLSFHRSGCYQITLYSLTAHDYLHFFHFSKSLLCEKEITIYPKRNKSIYFDATSYGEGFDEFEEASKTGNISSNVTDIREYQPGDRLQKIHWKLSAKIDKLMVKENEQTSSSQFTVLLELFQPDAASDCLEMSLSNGYSIACSLLEKKEPFFFSFYSITRVDFISLLIKTTDDLDAALLECFYQIPYSQEDLALTVLRKVDSGNGTILYATHKGVTDVIS